MLNKKAAGFFMVILLVFVIFVISYGVKVFLVDKNKIDIVKEIGDPQTILMETYQNAELDLFNLDQSVKYATYNAIEKFSNNGGLDENCNGQWKFNTNCEPNLEEDFLRLFNEKLKGYGYSNVQLVKIEDEVLSGNLDDFIYEEKVENFSFTYTVPTNFSQELAINLPIIEKLKQDLENCLRNKQDLEKCVDEDFEKNGRIIKFNIESDKKIMVFTDKIEFKKPIFRFELNLEDTGIETDIF